MSECPYSKCQRQCEEDFNFCPQCGGRLDGSPPLGYSRADYICLDDLHIVDGPAEIRNASRQFDYTDKKGRKTGEGTLQFVEILTERYQLCIYNSGDWDAYERTTKTSET